MKKVRVHITKTTVNAPTYSNVTFEPTLINFFYGKMEPENLRLPVLSKMGTLH